MQKKKPFYVEIISFSSEIADTIFKKYGCDTIPTTIQLQKLLKNNPSATCIQVYNRTDKSLLRQFGN